MTHDNRAYVKAPRIRRTLIVPLWPGRWFFGLTIGSYESVKESDAR